MPGGRKKRGVIGGGPSRDLRGARREGRGLRAEGGAVTVLDFDPATNGILKKVQKALAPDDPNALTAELYGLHVYSSWLRSIRVLPQKSRGYRGS